MKFEREEFPILPVIEEEMPEIIDEFTDFIDSARTGGVEEKFKLGAVLRQMVTSPFAGLADAPSLTKRTVTETLRQSFELFEECSAHGHLKSKILLAHFHAAGIPYPQDLPKARSLCLEVKNDPSLASVENGAESLKDLQDFIASQNAEPRRQHIRPPKMG